MNKSVKSGKGAPSEKKSTKKGEHSKARKSVASKKGPMAADASAIKSQKSEIRYSEKMDAESVVN